MQVKNTLIKLSVWLAAALPAAASAQTSSINAFSPYTMYGIGEVNTPGTLSMRSMGGVGVAMRNPGQVNLLNPAAYSATPQKSFLFSFGIEGQNYHNAQNDAGVKKRSAYTSVNFHDVAFQLPLAKRLGLGFSLTPYSSVGYRTKFYRAGAADDPVLGNVGPVQYTYQGEGDVTEVKLGAGWEIFKNFSVGAAAYYYWGNLDRSFVATFSPITGEGNFNSSVGSSRYSISSIKGQVGLQWSPILDRKRVLTFGATFDIGGDLRPRVTETVYMSDIYSTAVKDETATLELVLPRQLTAGVYYQTDRWTLGADYAYQNWGGSNKTEVRTGVGPSGGSMTVAYTDTHTFKVGAEFIPNRYDVRHFFRRWAYRAGFRYGTYNQTFGGRDIAQCAVTLGAGIPVKFLGSSSIDLGVEYGCRGFNVARRVGLVRQQYFKFAVGFSLFAGRENGEYWFMRPKYE